MEHATSGHRALPQTVLREATDRMLLDETIRQGRITRAELADTLGYSRPTVSEAVRRLVAAGLLDATGPKETGRRGRVGTFYELGTHAGWVLAMEIDQSGVRTRSADLAGRHLDERRHPPSPPGDSPALARSVRAAAGETTGGPGPLRAVAVSVANPVHPVTHEIVVLADSPFPEGTGSPVEMLHDVVPAPVLVDNDVNLAALAEHRAGAAAGAASFAYVFVGGGLGVGLYVGDQLIRGAHGLAGEIGYLPGAGRATLAGEFAAGDFGRPDAPSADVSAVLRVLDRAAASPEPVRRLADAVGRAVASVAVVVDPELILLGGPVGTHPALLPAVRAALAGRLPGPTRLDHGTLGTDAPLHGALYLALDHARAAAVSPTAARAIPGRPAQRTGPPTIG